MKKKPKKQDNNHLLKAAIPVLLFALYMILDYLNVSQLLGLSSNRINMDFFDVFLNSVIVVVLYIVTYYFVDRKQIQKDANAKDTADVLMLYTYKECLDNLRMLWHPKWKEEYIIPKVDGNKPINENRIVANIQNLPFASKDEILELSKGGYIEKEVLDRYLHIHKEYIYAVAMLITFYDLTNPQTDEQRAMFADINNRSDELMSLLGEEIKRLEAA